MLGKSVGTFLTFFFFVLKTWYCGFSNAARLKLDYDTCISDNELLAKNIGEVFYYPQSFLSIGGFEIIAGSLKLKCSCKHSFYFYDTNRTCNRKKKEEACVDLYFYSLCTAFSWKNQVLSFCQNEQITLNYL